MSYSSPQRLGNVTRKTDYSIISGSDDTISTGIDKLSETREGRGQKTATFQDRLALFGTRNRCSCDKFGPVGDKHIFFLRQMKI